jgi:peptidyl-prolyl cis-trans isomerase D
LTHYLKKHAGKTRWVSEAQMHAQLNQILSQMQRGQISKPFDMSSSTVIVKLLSVQPRKRLPYSAVSQQVIASLKDQKVQDLFSARTEQLSNLTYVNVNSLKPAADALNVTIETTPLMTQKNAKGLFAYPEVNQAAFNPAVLVEGNNSNPIMLKNGDIIVLRVDDYRPAAVPAFNAVKDRVERTYLKEAAQKQAFKQANILLSELKSGASPHALSKKNAALTWQIQRGLTLNTNRNSTELLQTVFQIPSHRLPAFMLQKLSNGDIAVIELTRLVLPPFDKMTGKDHQALSESLISGDQQLINKLYTHAVVKKAKIKLYRQNQVLDGMVSNIK